MMTLRTERASYQLKKFNEQRNFEMKMLVASGAFSQFDRFQAEAVPMIAQHIQTATSIALAALKEGDSATAEIAVMIASNSSYDMAHAYERSE